MSIAPAIRSALQSAKLGSSFTSVAHNRVRSSDGREFFVKAGDDSAQMKACYSISISTCYDSRLTRKIRARQRVFEQLQKRHLAWHQTCISAPRSIQDNAS
jgi:hypothetical protein